MIKIYNIEMKTPFGIKQGRITFVINNGSLNGVLEGMGTKNEFYNGRINGNNFEFSGQIKSFLVKTQYYANGTFNNNTLSGAVNTNYGVFSVTGILVSEA